MKDAFINLQKRANLSFRESSEKRYQNPIKCVVRFAYDLLYNLLLTNSITFGLEFHREAFQI